MIISTPGKASTYCLYPLLHCSHLQMLPTPSLPRSCWESPRKPHSAAPGMYVTIPAVRFPQWHILSDKPFCHLLTYPLLWPHQCMHWSLDPPHHHFSFLPHVLLESQVPKKNAVQTIAPMPAGATFFLSLVLPNLGHKLTLLHTNFFFIWQRTFTCASIIGGSWGLALSKVWNPMFHSMWPFPSATNCRIASPAVKCTYSTLVVVTHGGVLATHMLLLACYFWPTLPSVPHSFQTSSQAPSLALPWTPGPGTGSSCEISLAVSYRILAWCPFLMAPVTSCVFKVLGFYESFQTT